MNFIVKAPLDAFLDDMWRITDAQGILWMTQQQGTRFDALFLNGLNLAASKAYQVRE